jgi:CxxC motif-containing protein
MKRTLTCIVCPLGCTLEVELEGKTVVSVSGNTCPRGRTYAESECVAPMRTLTSTVRCTDGTPLAVKTDRPIPKDKVRDCMKIINSAIAPLPISIGDVIIKDVFGCNIVATQNKE